MDDRNSAIPPDEKEPTEAAYAELRAWQLLENEDEPTEGDDLRAVEELRKACRAEDNEPVDPEEGANGDVDVSFRSVQPADEEAEDPEDAEHVGGQAAAEPLNSEARTII